MPEVMIHVTAVCTLIDYHVSFEVVLCLRKEGRIIFASSV